VSLKKLARQNDQSGRENSRRHQRRPGTQDPGWKLPCRSYHRLNVVLLRIPPLRERPGDLLPLAQGLLDNFCQKSGLPKKTIASETVNVLSSYHYPGNVRQLQIAWSARLFSPH